MEEINDPLLKRNTRNQPLGISGNAASNSTPYGGGFRRGNHNQSSTNLRRGVTKAVEQEELIKYASRLPSYLEKGESRKEKVLNVGVLDWRRLEKWQFSQKTTLPRNSRYSESTAYTSSSFSVDGSSVHSSGGESSSPACQRTHRPSLQFHLMSSPIHGDCRVNNSFEDCNGKSPVLGDSQTNARDGRSIFIKTNDPCLNDHLERKSDLCNTKGVDPKIELTNRISRGRTKHEAFPCMNNKLKAREGALPNMIGKSKHYNACIERCVLRKGEEVLFTPTEFAKIVHPGPAVANQISSSNASKEFSDSAVTSHIRHPSTQPLEMNKCSKIRLCSEDEGSATLPNTTHAVQCQDRRGIGFHDGCSKMDNLTKVPENANCNKVSAGSKPKLNKGTAEKGRSTSPFRRLSIGIGRISKSFNSKESLSKPQLSSNLDLAKPISVTDMRLSQDSSNKDAQQATKGARSSPLRRLLHPLLKPKAASHDHFREPLHRDSLSGDRDCKSSIKEIDLSSGTAKLCKVQQNMSGCVEMKDNDSSYESKQKMSICQALLRYAHKNGQPFFSFAIENECDIIAATVKKLNNAAENECSCIYTFFSISGVEKKNNKWTSQAGKTKAQNYISNVVAQLKVSDSQFSNLHEKGYSENSIALEYVLFAVDLQPAEHQIEDIQPSNELAAIIVKVPQVIYRTVVTDNQQTGESTALQQDRSTSRKHVGAQNIVSTTVMLPSGLHSLPSKGGPSSLVQRWRSGGSCDCGGWDLACNLRILIDQNQRDNNPNATTNRFDLFSQEGEKQQFFSMVPFKDGIYSIEFDSSLSTLQAFSICVAVLHSRKFSEVSERDNLSVEKAALETTSVQNNPATPADTADVEAPAKHVMYPPLSPVGRV